MPNNDVARRLDHSMPAAHKAAAGSTLDDLCTAGLDLQTQFTALLAKLDAAGIAGGNNATTLALQAPPIKPLGSRKAIP